METPIYSPTGYSTHYYQLCTLTGDLDTDNAVLCLPISDDSDCSEFEHPSVLVHWDDNRIVTWFKAENSKDKTLHPYAIRLLNLAGIIVPERFIRVQEHEAKERGQNANGNKFWFNIFTCLATIAFLAAFQVANIDKSNPFIVVSFLSPVLAYWVMKFSI